MKRYKLLHIPTGSYIKYLLGNDRIRYICPYYTQKYLPDNLIDGDAEFVAVEAWNEFIHGFRKFDYSSSVSPIAYVSTEFEVVETEVTDV